MGRSSEKPENIIDLVTEYISECINTEKLPSIAGLAVFLDFTKQTLYNWAKDDNDFFDSLEKLKNQQEEITLNKSIRGEWNATISKLVLANHGYHEKQETTHKGKIDDSESDLSKLSDNELLELKRLREKMDG